MFFSLSEMANDTTGVKPNLLNPSLTWTKGSSWDNLNWPSMFLWITTRRRSPSHTWRRIRNWNRLLNRRWTNYWRRLHSFHKWDQWFIWRWLLGLCQSWGLFLDGINWNILQHSSSRCVCRSFRIRGWRSCGNIHIIKKIVQSHWEFTGARDCSWTRPPPWPSELWNLHIWQWMDGNIFNAEVVTRNTLEWKIETFKSVSHLFF